MRKKKILIVDDVRETLLALKIRLEYAGYEVFTAADGEAGLKAARDLKPDLILLDVMLPKIDGFSICRLLKFDDEYARIPIIMLTAKGQTSDMEIGKQVGADAYMTKPYNAKDLIAKVTEFTSTDYVPAKLGSV
ncbi:MAG: response regulator [bacterium]